MKKEEIIKLAELSRLELSESEINEYTTELSNILEYIEKIKNAETPSDESRMENAKIRNVTRPDKNPHEGNQNTDDILENAPETQDKYIRVQKIL